jgi:hypothetical protein
MKTIDLALRRFDVCGHVPPIKTDLDKDDDQASDNYDG